jgi:hypothetical protein
VSGQFRKNRNSRDANERALLDLALQLGGEWIEAPPLDGWIFVARMGALCRCVEIKRPEREGLAWEYTPLQKRFLARAAMIGMPIWIWRTSADVLRDLNG